MAEEHAREYIAGVERARGDGRAGVSAADLYDVAEFDGEVVVDAAYVVAVEGDVVVRLLGVAVTRHRSQRSGQRLRGRGGRGGGRQRRLRPLPFPSTFLLRLQLPRELLIARHFVIRNAAHIPLLRLFERPLALPRGDGAGEAPPSAAVVLVVEQADDVVGRRLRRGAGTALFAVELALELAGEG